ncbi:ROK family transcriptional regulator [Cohnella thermotolerans]|uniref:ROK family transcriptional regulator n=1 Tax=Cohnella thermotolerans TaxID=329858 RepID=UPI00041DBB90|nr:ROK family transcriptional regulator [Cohnella thermotolerans]
MHRVKGNLQLMKGINTASLLSLLHREGELSRADLSRMTKLSPTTVSALVEELIGRGLVEEVGEKAAEGAGRRAISLRINPGGGYVIGLSLSGQSLQCVLMDLHGGVLAEWKTPIAEGNGDIAAQLQRAVAQCAERTKGMEAGSLQGIGVAAPGIIDEASGSVVYSSYLKLSDLKVRKLLEAQHPEVPIRVVNDTNAAAFAEHYDGSGKDSRHLLYLTIGRGIGSGLILDGRIYSGSNGAAGEIGHIPVDPEGELCECGRRGCIETAVTAPYIMRKVRGLAAGLGFAAPASMEEALRLYENGRQELEPMFDRIASIVSYAVAAAINFIGPEAVVLDGWVTGSGKFMDKLRAELGRFPFPVPFDLAKLRASAHGEKGSLYGAATLMLQQIFQAAI